MNGANVYVATLYTKGPDAIPVTYDNGIVVEREMVAATAAKARYRFWTDLQDAWGDDAVRLVDIRVRALKTPAMQMLRGWEERLWVANQAIQIIGSYGRCFLSENSDRRPKVAKPFFAYFKADRRGELWFIDRYTRKPILVRHDEWPGFTDGGTLRRLIEAMRDYIVADGAFPMNHFGPWPTRICDGDLWGYGSSMANVRRDVDCLLSSATEAAGSPHDPPNPRRAESVRHNLTRGTAAGARAPFGS